jgi:hypothetical protein
MQYVTVVYAPPNPQYVACNECGACFPRWEEPDHVCDRERWLDYQLVKLRDEREAFDADFGAWLATPYGLFEQWYAVRERARQTPPSRAEKRQP